MNTIIDRCEHRVLRIRTSLLNTPYKYDNGITKGWALKGYMFTEDGNIHTITHTFRLKRDAIAYQQKHIDGSDPTWEMTVTVENGKPVAWSECFGMRFKG